MRSRPTRPAGTARSADGSSGMTRGRSHQGSGAPDGNLILTVAPYAGASPPPQPDETGTAIVIPVTKAIKVSLAVPKTTGYCWRNQAGAEAARVTCAVVEKIGSIALVFV